MGYQKEIELIGGPHDGKVIAYYDDIDLAGCWPFIGMTCFNMSAAYSFDEVLVKYVWLWIPAKQMSLWCDD